MRITATLRAWVMAEHDLMRPPAEAETERLAKSALASGRLSQTEFDHLTKTAPSPRRLGSTSGDRQGSQNMTVTNKTLLGSINSTSGSYATTKATGLHVKTGKPV